MEKTRGRGEYIMYKDNQIQEMFLDIRELKPNSFTSGCFLLGFVMTMLLLHFLVGYPIGKN